MRLGTGIKRRLQHSFGQGFFLAHLVDGVDVAVDLLQLGVRHDLFGPFEQVLAGHVQQLLQQSRQCCLCRVAQPGDIDVACDRGPRRTLPGVSPRQAVVLFECFDHHVGRLGKRQPEMIAPCPGQLSTHADGTRALAGQEHQLDVDLLSGQIRDLVGARIGEHLLHQHAAAAIVTYYAVALRPFLRPYPARKFDLVAFVTAPLRAAGHAAAPALRPVLPRPSQPSVDPGLRPFHTRLSPEPEEY